MSLNIDSFPGQKPIDQFSINRVKAYYYVFLLILLLSGCTDKPSPNTGIHADHTTTQLVPESAFTGFDPGVLQHIDLIERFFQQRDYLLAAAILQMESCGYTNAYSGAAFGLWQLSLEWTQRDQLNNLVRMSDTSLIIPSFEDLQVMPNNQSFPNSAAASDSQLLKWWLQQPENNTHIAALLVQHAIGNQGYNYAAILAEYNGGLYAGSWMKKTMDALGIPDESQDWLTPDVLAGESYQTNKQDYVIKLMGGGFSLKAAIAKAEQVERYVTTGLGLIYNDSRHSAYLDWLDRGGDSLCALSSQEQRGLTSDATIPQHSSYIVQPGDTLAKIARDHGVPLPELFEANKTQPFADNPNLIYPGQTVLIPSMPSNQ